MKNLLILDIDGVLITTPPWKQDGIHSDGYSEFNETNVANLNQLLSKIENVEIWLSSTRRLKKTLAEFNEIFINRKIEKQLSGFLPIEDEIQKRVTEINNFLDRNKTNRILIIDDDSTLESLTEERKKYWIKTDLLLGFNNEKLNEALSIVENW
jgi:hypothetical protein